MRQTCNVLMWLSCTGGADDRSDAGSAFGSAESDSFAGGPLEEGGEDGGGLRERHECVVCGITTTSAAHLEVCLAHRMSIEPVPCKTSLRGQAC